MTNRIFNEAESFLLKNWGAVSQLEKSMLDVREKYQQLCERIAEDFCKRHPDLDTSRVRVMHRSRSARSGSLWVSKKTWPKDGKSPVGIWIENIRLEYLVDDETPPPLSSIWIKPFEKRLPLEPAKAKLLEAAWKLLPQNFMENRATALPDDGYVLGFEFCEKHELLASLADPSAEMFAQRLTSQLDMLVKLVPAVDALVATNARGAT